MSEFTFYLGAHHADWLESVSVPLFVSRRSLHGRKRLPIRAEGQRWALDSGGFTELSMHGRWLTDAKTYARDVLRFSDEIGGLDWAAPQDWMCEPEMLAKTGRSVEQHQELTVASVLELRAMGVKVIPVLQGWTMGQYFDCVELYSKNGIELRSEPVVGLGSVCRRQRMTSAALIVSMLADEGISLHGFGFKASGLQAVADKMRSADSLAWSLNARKSSPRPECLGKHQSCSNCADFALEWRDSLLGKLGKEFLQVQRCA